MPSCFMGVGAFPGAKRSEREADHKSLPNAPQFALMACTLPLYHNLYGFPGQDDSGLADTA